jgi:hypothetical protein
VNMVLAQPQHRLQIGWAREPRGTCARELRSARDPARGTQSARDTRGNFTTAREPRGNSARDPIRAGIVRESRGNSIGTGKGRAGTARE